MNSQEHTEHYEECQLDKSEDVDTVVWYPPKVFAVWPTLARDEEKLDALNELDTIEGGHAHVEKKAVQNRKWEEIENRVRHH